MLYRGTTAEEMGDPVEAMRWYKRTELAAREIGDDRLAGIALLSMGVLYMNQYTTSQAQQKLKAALPMLDKTDDEHYKYTLELLGQSYAKASYDTACQYIEQLRLRSIARSDTFYLNTSRNLTITTLYYNNRYRATVDSLNAIPPEQRTFPSLHYGCVSLCKLGESDSARLFFDMAPPPATSVDSMLYLHSLAEISRAEKDYQDADNAETASSDISGSCLADAVADSKLPTAEAKALDEISGQSKIWHVVLVMVVTALMALIGLAARLFYTAKRANDSESRARELQRDIDRMANNRDQLASELGRISNKLSARLSESVSLSQQLEAAKKELAEAKARIEEAGKRHKKSLKHLSFSVICTYKSCVTVFGLAGRPRLGVADFFLDTYLGAHLSGMSKPNSLQMSTCAPTNGVMNFIFPLCSMHLMVRISARMSSAEPKFSDRNLLDRCTERT